PATSIPAPRRALRRRRRGRPRSAYGRLGSSAALLARGCHRRAGIGLLLAQRCGREANHERPEAALAVEAVERREGAPEGAGRERRGEAGVAGAAQRPGPREPEGGVVEGPEGARLAAGALHPGDLPLAGFGVDGPLPGDHVGSAALRRREDDGTV